MKHLLLLALLLPCIGASAQSPCDDLTISVTYSPFTDTLIIVEVTNAGVFNFNYPGFVLINAEGDTLAMETVNYFGIGEQSVHHLRVRPGVGAPLDVFYGVLELYSGFYSDLECSWTLNQSFCALDVCEELVIGLENWGGALVTGDFEWVVSDSTGAEVGAGQFTMTADDQYWQHSLCVAPGVYAYQLVALEDPSGGGPTMTVASGQWFGSLGMSQPFSWLDGGILEVPFFLHCVEQEVPNGILQNDVSVHTDLVQVLYDNQGTVLDCIEPFSIVTLYGLDGRQIWQWAPKSTRTALPLALSPGMYVVHVSIVSGMYAVRVAVL